MVRKNMILGVLFALAGLGMIGWSFPSFSGGATAAFVPAGAAPVSAPQIAAGETGPDEFPAGVNPLTGLPVEDPALLKLPPAMISITNFPISARPQAGLSQAAYVFEVYIGKGMTRYLGLFYGDYPKASSKDPSASAAGSAAIGPIRSGRLPYESLRQLYSGFLVMSGASSEVKAQLSTSATIFGSDNSDINSALIDVTRLQKIAEANQKPYLGPLNLTGNRYETAAPAGGKPASKAHVFYNFYNQIEWAYDGGSGAYLRSQDQADGSGKFYPATDRLNGEQLAFENVVVLFTEHIAQSPTLIDVELMYRKIPALLFRDGQVYRIFASTENGEYEKSTKRLRPLRFVDAQGDPFPMKPGQTWVEIVTSSTTAQEVKAGEWKVRFYAP